MMKFPALCLALFALCLGLSPVFAQSDSSDQPELSAPAAVGVLDDPAPKASPPKTPSANSAGSAASAPEAVVRPAASSGPTVLYVLRGKSFSPVDEHLLASLGEAGYAVSLVSDSGTSAPGQPGPALIAGRTKNADVGAFDIVIFGAQFGPTSITISLSEQGQSLLRQALADKKTVVLQVRGRGYPSSYPADLASDNQALLDKYKLATHKVPSGGDDYVKVVGNVILYSNRKGTPVTAEEDAKFFKKRLLPLFKTAAK